MIVHQVSQELSVTSTLMNVLAPLAMLTTPMSVLMESTPTPVSVSQATPVKTVTLKLTSVH